METGWRCTLCDRKEWISWSVFLDTAARNVSNIFCERRFSFVSASSNDFQAILSWAGSHTDSVRCPSAANGSAGLHAYNSINVFVFMCWYLHWIEWYHVKKMSQRDVIKRKYWRIAMITVAVNTIVIFFRQFQFSVRCN